MSQANKKSTPAKVTKPAEFVGQAISQVDALAALNNVVDAGREYLRIHEEETTKRARLDAYATLESGKIREAGRVLNDYFDRVFKERSKNFEEMWSRLDAAAEAGDDDAVRTMLGGIVQLAQDSPLGGLAEDLPALRAAFDDPDQVWEL